MSYEDGGMPAGGNSRFRGYPARMSERQQLALLLQMTSQDITSGTSNRSDSSAPISNARSSPLQHQKNSKGRWSNKNADFLDVNSSYSRQDDRIRLVNGCDAKDRNDFAGSNSPDEVRTATRAESPVVAGSPAECAATVITAPGGARHHHYQETRREQQQQHHQHHHHHHHHQHHQHQVDAEPGRGGGGFHSFEQHAEDSGATYEMRRTPPQNKVDRQSTGGAGSGVVGGAGQQSGGSAASSSSGVGGGASSGGGVGPNSGSPRVTLRLNQVRATRDDKKGSAPGVGLGSGGTSVTGGGIISSVGQSSGGGASSTGSASSISSSTSASAIISSSSRQVSSVGSSSSASLMSTSQMEATSTKPSSSGGGGIASSTTASPSSNVGVGGSSGIAGSSAGINSASSSSSADVGDVYEFKSSKEATPVRGSSSSPNPNLDKDGKEATSSSMVASSGSGQGQSISCSASSACGNIISSTGSSSAMDSNAISSSETTSSTSAGGTVGSSSSSSTNTGAGSSTEAMSVSIVSSMADEQMMSTSPSSSTSILPSSSTKRTFDSENPQDDQDEESRKRKKKDNESNKDVTCVKGVLSGRQAANRNSASIVDKSVKSGKQATGTISAKSGQINTSLNSDHKSPSSSLNANSPKPSNASATSTSNNTKGSASVSAESDGEEDRSKNPDCNSAPKVPPLKIVIPQSTTSEQEQGNRNGKNTSNRGHQLPYVVASSNSNDSIEKDQNTSVVISGGTTNPLDNGSATSKNDEKKEISSSLDNESRSTHHQRVLRSSHRSGNGGNGNSGARESSSNMSGNGNYSNSSPLPASTADRSNNSSPQQRHHSPTPESSGISEAGKTVSTDAPIQNSPIGKSGVSMDKCEKNVEMKKETGDSLDSNVKKESGTEVPSTSSQAPVELHPRKRKMKSSKETQQAAATAAASEPVETTNTGPEIHPHDQPITNCYQLFLNIRKQIERRRKCLFPVQPKPPQGFKDYLMNRCTYVLAGNANEEPNINPPVNLMGPMKDLYIEQEKERYRLRMQHVVEKEKLVLSVEQEILRVHGRAARALANQSLPFSVCTILKDEEVYNVITPEQEEKDRNARSRYNGRLFLSWLQDVDDKWEKIKEAMLLRHHNEAESLHAVQRMDWEWKLKEVGLCEFKVTPQIEDLHVPMVHVSDDFDLLPA